MSRSIAIAVVALVGLLEAFASAQGLPGMPRPARKGHKLQVKIESFPQGATIYVDSKQYPAEGYTPATVKLPKGSYKIILELPGYKPVERDIQVARSQAFVFQLEKQARPAVIDVRAGDASAQGASITVDGSPVGTVPNRIEVVAGNHGVEVKRPGFLDYKDSLQVAEGETRTVVVVLATAVKPGSILVTADTSGAEVFVDNTRRDTAPTVINDLPEGAHTVEVKKEGLNPFKQVVMVIGGQQTKVAAQLQPVAPAAGAVKILSSTPGAEVVIDGDVKGAANAEVGGVKAGTHIVEVRAAGFDAKRIELEVKPNETRVVQMDLLPSAVIKQTASIRIISPLPDAQVFIDGANIGAAPIDKTDLSPGKHFVVVHKDGFADFKQEVDLEAGKTLQLSANLSASGSIRAMSNVPGCDIFLDGAPTGKKTPTTLEDVPAGTHVIEFKLAGYLDGKQTVSVGGGGQQIVQVELTPISSAPSVFELQKAQREQSSFGATAIDRFKFNFDVGLGWPYFFDLRMTMGIYRFSKGGVAKGGMGFDVGILFKTDGFENSVGIRPRVQLIRYDPVAVAADFVLAGGGGPLGRNTFTFEAGAILTFIAGPYARINFRPYLSYTSDQLCPTVGSIQTDDEKSAGSAPGRGDLYQKQEMDTCKSRDAQRTAPSDYKLPGTVTGRNVNAPDPQYDGLTPDRLSPNPREPDPRGRLENLRLMLQASIEWLATQNLNLWIMVEGDPIPNTERAAFLGKFNSIFPSTDIQFYFRLGLTAKF